MKTYSAFKPSGVSWIGEIPSNWSVKQIRYLAAFVKTGSTPSAEAFVDESKFGDIPWYSPSDIVDGELSSEPSKVVSSEFLHEVTIFPKNTILLVGIGDVGRVALTKNNATGNQQLNFIGFDDGVIPEFARYSLEFSQGFTLSRSNKTLLPILNQEQTKRLKLPLPALDEQQAIVNYLDIEIIRIDGLIEAKQDLIKLLVEYRQSVISDAVLKGIDPHAPLKPSGVDWLGEVPAHWQVKKVKFLAEIVNTKIDTNLNGQRYIGLEHIESKTGQFMQNTDGMQTEAESTVNLFNKGCVLFGKLRPYLAKAVVADTDGICSSEFLVLHPLHTDAEYLKRCMLLDGFIKTVDASTFGAKMPRADWTFISQLNLPQPPIEEQKNISNYLNNETKKFDVLINHAKAEIALLKELRASTIADAVLGRIKLI